MSATTLQRLLKHPHAAVFDKDPLAELVLRVSHAGGSSWVVAAGVLTVVAGGEEFTYQLAGYTVSTLANAMQADGLSVTRVNSQYGHLSALALVEGASDQWLSNGDHLRVFTSLLWALLQGYSREVDAAQEQIRQALLQMVIATAEGEWLDLWGTLYDVPRLAGESDADLRTRIPREAFRLRVNALGIEQAILDATGWVVRIDEPWKDVFTLDQSMLSGPDRFYDGGRYGPHLISPYTRDAVDWGRVLDVIHRNRAAGVMVVGAEHGILGMAELGPSQVYAGITSGSTGIALYEDRVFLDYMAIEDTALPNHPIQRKPERIHSAMAENDEASWGTFDNGTWAWSGSGWSMPPYFAHFEHERDYRVFYLDVRYAGQTWADTPGTWSQDRGWNSDVILYSAHSRS